MRAQTERASSWTVALALGTVYLVWGSTYAAIRVALEGFPPFLLGATRFLTAGLLLFLIAVAFRQPLPSREELRDAGVLGSLFLFLGNGGVVWSEQYIASGLAAIIVATVPLCMVALDAAHPRGAPLTKAVVLSSLLGLLGVGLIVGSGFVLGSGAGFWMGVAAVCFASLTWSIGAIYAHHARKPRSHMMSAAMQMLAGGVGLLLTASVHGEWERLDVSRIGGAPLWASLYLIVFGSLVGFSAFAWLVRSAPPAVAGTYAYVNPVVAVLLGVLILDEKFTSWMVAGSLLILLSVILTQRAQHGRRTAVASLPDERGKRPVPRPAKRRGARACEEPAA